MTSVVVFGAGGRAGRQILAEARRRSIEATAVVRDPAKYPDISGAVAGDATDAGLVERAARGHDVAISAVYGADLDPAAYGEAMAALLHGLERARVRRLLLIGVATTLPGDSGARKFEEPGFPAEWRPFSQARADELAVLERYDGAVDWVVFTPPMELVEDEGSSGYQIRNFGNALSYTALAAALLDEVAADRHHRTQLGVSGI
ncbi:NAD(P)-dependent oxidoreductase [Dactylosporangium sp. NPDC048998]|uniref:NAD(P)-dependent oxidoreductase n=1 Tax=Dactylosporangium sp. NPDC048998 TaxID=3363976 RepID=UPI0037168D54